jgi:hypothetical protein
MFVLNQRGKAKDITLYSFAQSPVTTIMQCGAKTNPRSESFGGAFWRSDSGRIFNLIPLNS